MSRDPDEIRFDGWVLRRSPRELLRDGVAQRLQDQPLQILDELASNPNVLITRERLIARLWPSGIVEFDGSLNTAMRKLRTVLGDDADTPRYIETVPRQGYRFIGKLQEPKVPARRSWKWPAIAAVAVLAAITLWAARIDRAATPPGPVRIAVLPFQNLSPDPADAYFTDGLHEEVLATLVNRAPALDVISRTTVLTYRGTPKSASTIARELSVTHLLEGSVRREGRTVRLTLQLIDARNDSQLWARNFDSELTSAMLLQSQVAADVASQLALELAVPGDALPPSQDPRAYDLYLKAKLAAQPFGGRASLERLLEVERWLDQALAIDPAFAAAHLERGRNHLRKFDNSYDVSDGNLAAIRTDLAQVHALAGQGPLLLMTEAYYLHIVDQDLAAAIAKIDLPDVRASKDVTVLIERARLLSHARRLDEALAIYQEAARFDPRNPGLLDRWHALLWNARRPAEALVVMRYMEPALPPRVAFEFSFTGRTEQLDEAVNPVSRVIDPGIQLMARSNRFRQRGKLAESIALLEGAGLERVRQDSFSPVSIPAIGRKPVAELHGWAMLLAGDAAGAARDARLIREFLASEPSTKWNAWFLKFLAAESALFAGEKKRAAEEARTALALAPRNVDTAIDRFAPMQAAMILAWAGEPDEATGLLEGLTTGFPGVGPAEITREPLIAAPLAGNARFEALKTRMETEIAANSKLF